MSTDPVGRFLTALDPDHRKVISAKPREEQERLAAAWERDWRKIPNSTPSTSCPRRRRKPRRPAASWTAGPAETCNGAQADHDHPVPP
ncbi:hypothetical protein SHIRM173S_01703 [Streptomyces hirsutus]